MAVNQITKVRMPDGEEIPLVDWSHRPLYSTVWTLSGFSDQEIRAFNYVESGVVSATNNFTAAQQVVANISHTNVASANEMDATEEFLVYAIRCEMFALDMNGDVGDDDAAQLPVPNAANVMKAQLALILELEVSEKAFPQAGLAWFAAGMGPVISSVGPVAAARTMATNGLASREAISDLVIPVHLGGTEDYSVILHNPNGTLNWKDEAGGNVATAVMIFRIYLDGLQKRATA